MALQYNQKTGRFEESGATPAPARTTTLPTPVQTTTQRRSFNPDTGLFELPKASVPTSPVIDINPQRQNLLAQVGRGALGIAKEAVLSPIRFFASPIAMLDEGLRKPGSDPDAFVRFVFGNNKFGTKERAGGAALNALTGATMLIGGGGAASAIKEGGTQGLKAGVKELGRQTIKNLPLDATLGAGFGVASGLQEGASGEDLLKSGAIGAGVGVAAPLVLGGLFRGATGVIRGSGSFLDSSIERRVSALAAKEAKIKAQMDSFYGPTTGEATMLQTISRKTDRLNSLRTAPDRLRTAVFDKFHPLYKLQTEIKKQTGEDVDLRELAQSAAHKGRQQADIIVNDEFMPLVKTFGDDWKYVLKYAELLNEKDRLALGNKVTGGRTLLQNKADMERLAADVGDKFSSVERGYAGVRLILDRELENAVESGTLSRESVNNFKRTHPNYTPNIVVDFLDNPDAYAQKAGGGLSRSKSGYFKADGSVREILPADQAIVKKIYDLRLSNALNAAAKDIVTGVEQVGGRKFGFEALRTAANVKSQIDILTKLRLASGEIRGKVGAAAVLSKAERKTEAKIAGVLDEIAALTEEAQSMAAAGADTGANFERDISNILFKVTNKEAKKTIAGNALAQLQSAKDAIKTDINLLRSVRSELKDRLADVRDIKTKRIDITNNGGETVSFFRDGIKEIWRVPKELGQAMKNIDPSEYSALGKWLDNSLMGQMLKAPATAVRKLATQYNPIFALGMNPIRDIQTARVTSSMRYTDWGLIFAKGLFSMFAPESEIGREMAALTREIKIRGGLTGGFFSDTGVNSKLIRDAVSNKSPFSRYVKNPFHAVEQAGQFMEETTRKAVFFRALKETGSLDIAAKMSRSSTVDFSRGGAAIQTLNKVVPFLNARVQGLSTLGRAIAERPEITARRLISTAAYPTAVLYAHNSRYGSYQMIPDWEKRGYWIVMIGEEDGKDFDGNPKKVPNYIKIPKGEAQQALSAILERTFNVGREKYPETTGKFLYELAKGISPVTDSSILPTAIQFPVELTANYSFFRDKNIDPDFVLAKDGKWYKKDELPPEERVSYDTSEIAKTLGEVLGWSPSKIDYVLRTGLLNDLIRGTDLVIKGLPDGGTPFQEATSVPGIRSLTGSSNYGLDIKDKAAALEILRQQNQDKINGATLPEAGSSVPVDAFAAFRKK